MDVSMDSPHRRSFLINDIFNKAEQANKKQRLHTLKDLDRAAITVKTACDLMLEQACPYQDVRAKVMLNIGPRKLTAAIAAIEELTHPPDDRYYPELQTKYRSLRGYPPHVLTSIEAWVVGSSIQSYPNSPEGG